MALIDKLRKQCMALPGTTEEYPWDHVAWKVGGKLYAITSDPPERITVCTSLENQSVMIQDPAISIASYIGKHGWITIELADKGIHALVSELIHDSYVRVRSKLPKKAQAGLAEVKK